ncbi:DENN domain-containing protein 2A isoform X2 [Perca flavescens]|uniref:DENN domain-containing protein 2A isoform X2 n=1 Tax=Perca flavescens TaxID=8167 RepID=UPI00106EE12F|nr:DENN domain-containing protein 2A-like isoform X2 [Perca flavescens]
MNTRTLYDRRRCLVIMAATKRMTSTPDCIYSTVNRVKKGCAAGERSDFHIALVEKKEAGQRREGAPKLPFTPLDNLSNQESPIMAYRRPSFNPHSNENTLLVGNKLPRSNVGKIKDKISLWEGKEPTHLPITSSSLGQCPSIKRTESLTKNSKASDEQSAESCKRVAHKEKENLGKENVAELGDSRPCSPVETGKQQKGTLKSSKPSELENREDCGRVVHKEKQNHEKENVEKLGDSRPCSPTAAVQQQVGTLRKSNERRTAEQTSQEKRAVFTLFKNLDAMRENHGRTPPELGNYFSPPSKDKQVVMGQTSAVKGKQQQQQQQENVYTEPGAPPINPVPKPQRTFEHPATAPIGKNQRLGGEQRNLPPLPSISTKTSSKPPSGVYGRPRGERGRDNVDRKSFELEDLAGSTSPLFSRSLSQEHHYEDIPDSSKENPYEDIELESQCSQQSLPSSPGADTAKTSRPGFFRQNSGRSLKLLDLRRTNQSSHSTSSGGVSSPPQLSRPSTPTGPEHTSWLPGDPYSRTCRRIPTVVLRINSIFDARIGKKHLRRIYHYAETSSGRDENSDSESEVEERSKAHRQRLVSVQSKLNQPSKAHYNGTNTRSSSLEQELHQRMLFEYFLVVSLQKSKAGAHYLPEVTQQFPPKLERSFKFMRETEDQLRIIPQFCFPDAKDWEPVENYPSEMFSFVLTGEDGSRRFGYCRRLLPSGKGKRLPEVYCIVSHLGCFNLFSKVLDEVERRRALSPALVQPFMRAIMEAQFPGPGRTITIKTFLPGSGTEVMELCRPSDSRLEHVDFECLFSCLSLRLLLRVLGSLLLERRVIFTADKLSTLSQCCHAVVALLYPFVWQHTYIPVLPSAMLDIVCTPTPFIVGLLSSSLPQLTELPLEEVLVVDLGKSRFLRQLDDEDSILPSKLQSALENVLERRRELANDRGDTPGDSGHLSTVVSEAFVRFFVELVGHYPLFITGEREDGYSSSSSSPVPCSFQREGFRKAIPSKTVRRFLEVFMETQMFGWFIQERELHRQALRGLFEVRVQEYLDSIHENEHRRVNRFLKGLGNKMKFLSKK